MSDDLRAIRRMMEEDRRKKEADRHVRRRLKESDDEHRRKQVERDLQEGPYWAAAFLAPPIALLVFIVLCETGVITPW